tara:strand:+ start:101 stop:397 length:297 start_codon:yes stop_codon:yes gene_type:complete
LYISHKLINNKKVEIMLNALKSHIYAIKYEYDIWMAQRSIRSYQKYINKHENKYKEKVEKLTEKRDRKVNPYKKYIKNIQKKIDHINNKLNNLNYDFE